MADTDTDTLFCVSSIPDTIMADTDTDIRYFFHLLVTILFTMYYITESEISFTLEHMVYNIMLCYLIRTCDQNSHVMLFNTVTLNLMCCVLFEFHCSSSL